MKNTDGLLSMFENLLLSHDMRSSRPSSLRVQINVRPKNDENKCNHHTLLAFISTMPSESLARFFILLALAHAAAATPKSPPLDANVAKKHLSKFMVQARQNSLHVSSRGVGRIVQSPRAKMSAGTTPQAAEGNGCPDKRAGKSTVLPCAAE